MKIYMTNAIISRIDVTWLILSTLCCRIFSVNSWCFVAFCTTEPFKAE